MMWGYGYNMGWGGGLLMTLGMVVVFGLLIWALARWASHSSAQQNATVARGASSRELLGQRYARGEIDTATFEQMRERLDAPQSIGSPLR